MIRIFAAASAALLFLGACPQSGAAEADQTIRVQNGTIRCLLSADYEGRGQPAAICGRTDGGPFMVSPAPLNLAVVLGTGAMFFQAGSIPGPESNDVVLGVGQTHDVNGWTVRTEELRTLITNDIGNHGMRVNPVEAFAIWL